MAPGLLLLRRKKSSGFSFLFFYTSPDLSALSFFVEIMLHCKSSQPYKDVSYIHIPSVLLDLGHILCRSDLLCTIAAFLSHVRGKRRISGLMAC